MKSSSDKLQHKTLQEKGVKEVFELINKKLEEKESELRIKYPDANDLSKATDEYDAYKKELLSKAELILFSGSKENVEQLKFPRQNTLNNDTEEILSIKRKTVDISLNETLNDTDEWSIIRQFYQLLPKELLDKYNRINTAMCGHIKVSQDQPQRTYIDVEKIYSEDIEKWIQDVKVHIRNTDKNCDEKALQEFEASAWIMFQATADVYNTNAIIAEIDEEIAKTDYEHLIPITQETIRKEISSKISIRFPYHSREINLLIKTLHKTRRDDFTTKEVVEMIKKILKVHRIERDKKILAIAASGALIGSMIRSVQPYLWSNLFEKDGVNFDVILQYLALDGSKPHIEKYFDSKMLDFKLKVEKRMSELTLKALFYKDLQDVNAISYGEFERTLNEGLQSMQKLVRSVAATAPALMTLTMSLSLMAMIHPVLGAFGMTSIPATVYLNRKVSKKVRAKAGLERYADTEKETLLKSMKDNTETLGASGNPDAAIDKIGELTDKQLHADANIDKINIKWRPIRNLPGFISEALSFLIGGYMVKQGLIQPGAIMSTIQYTSRLRWKVDTLLETFFQDIPMQMAEIQRFEDTIGDLLQIDEPGGVRDMQRVPMSELPNLDISLNGISFIVDKEQNPREVLKDLDMTIKEGEFVTIVGNPGAGKTTLLRLLTGLYKPDSGKVLIGNTETKDIRKYGADSLQNKRVLSVQKPQLFDGASLRDNLTVFDNTNISNEQVKEIMESVQLGRLIESLDVKKGHYAFSGGEAVCISIARALIQLEKNDTGRGILLLDEPTASLNTEWREMIYSIIKDIRNKYKNLTIICVTHDDVLARGPDRRTVVIDGGKVKEI